MLFIYRVSQKVRSSNFMHYNFWSKLYFYMKFLEDVYFCTEYMYSEFQWLACTFWFFITLCSRCGVKWDTVCRPTDDPFWAFLSPGAQESVHPQTIFVYFRQLKKKIYTGHSSISDNHPGFLPQQDFCTSLQIWDQLGVTWQTKQRFFFSPSQGPLILSILNNFL